VAIPAANVVAAVTAQIVLFNLEPPAGGQSSNAIAVTIQ
jgi:hypothetical protein